jgi:hypothetical protein
MHALTRTCMHEVVPHVCTNPCPMPTAADTASMRVSGRASLMALTVASTAPASSKSGRLYAHCAAASRHPVVHGPSALDVQASTVEAEGVGRGVVCCVGGV